MKKKIILGIIIAVTLLLVLTVPYKIETYKDGGTKEYTSLTYKVVDWNKQVDGGKYENRSFYFFPKNTKSVDELWKTEAEKVPVNKEQTQSKPDYSQHYKNNETFTATVLSVDGTEYSIERADGGRYIMRLSDNTEIIKKGEKAHREMITQGNTIAVTFDGVVLKSEPGQLGTVYLVEILE